MKHATWIAALLIVALGAWAILAVPPSTAALGAGAAWRQPAASPLSAGGQPARLPRVVHPEMLVIEKSSPVVAPDGTLAESVGVEVDNGQFMPVLKKGRRIPVMEFLPVGSATAEQTELRFHILRGDSETAAANHSLAWVRISGLPPFEGAKPRVALMFAVRDDTIVMAAMEPNSGAPVPFELSGPWGSGR